MIGCILRIQWVGKDRMHMEHNMQYVPPQAACNDKAEPNIVPAIRKTPCPWTCYMPEPVGNCDYCSRANRVRGAAWGYEFNRVF